MPLGDDPARNYLALRGLSSIPDDIRYLARCPHGPRPRTIFEPALLVAVREGKALQAVQRIFLEPGHARHKSKAMLGRMARGAWQGRRSGAVLALAEGFETAAAFSQLTGLSCWASLGAWRLDRIALPAEIREIVIAEDNDAEGARAAARAYAYYASIGLDVRRFPPPHRHNDWADVLEDADGKGRGVGRVTPSR